MHVIKDAVHGDIQVSDAELKLIDTPEMQKLRGIRQMAVAYLVYPGRTTLGLSIPLAQCT